MPLRWPMQPRMAAIGVNTICSGWNALSDTGSTVEGIELDAILVHYISQVA